MKKVFLIIFLFITKICFGQKTTEFADSICKAYNIPEISYPVIDDKSTLEIAALEKHSIDLADTAS